MILIFFFFFRNDLRHTQSKKLKSISEASLANNVFLGKDGQGFYFEDLPFSVTFAEGSALTANKSFELKAMSEWIAELA